MVVVVGGGLRVRRSRASQNEVRSKQARASRLDQPVQPNCDARPGGRNDWFARASWDKSDGNGTMTDGS